MDDYQSMHMRLSANEMYKHKKMMRMQRIHHLQSSKYSYESAHAKGSWAKDNPSAYKLLESLLMEDADDTAKELKAEMGPEKGSKGAESRQPGEESKATGSNESKETPQADNFTKDTKQVSNISWSGKRK